MGLGPPGPPLIIHKKDEVSFIEGYRQFCELYNKPPLPLFLRWFAKGCYEADHADKILGLMVALEALVLREIEPRDRGELKLRLSLRIAWLLGTDKSQREALVKMVKEHYDLRSMLVHGGELKMNAAELKKHAEDLEALARSTILRWIAAKASGVPI